MVQQTRTARHDRVLDHVVTRLEDHGYRVEREAPINTTAGFRYPDIVAWDPRRGQSWVLDAQVVADASVCDLSAAHMRKVEYYNIEEIRRRVEERTGCPPHSLHYHRQLEGHPGRPNLQHLDPA